MSHAASQWAKTVITGGTTNKAILMVLADYANHSHEAWPSFERVAKEAECSVSTVKRAVADMEARGLLTRQRRRQPDGKLGCYVLVLNVKPQVKMTAGQKPELNLTSGQSDLRSNTTETRAQIELTEPCKIEPLEEAAAATAHAPAREPQANLTPGPDWRLRLAEATDRAADALDETNPATKHAADLRRLCEPTTGPPCDWERDVLPAIDTVAAQVRRDRKLIRSWTWIRATALDFRNRRLAGNPEIAHVPAFASPASAPLAARHGSRPRSFASIGLELAARAAEAERRQREGGNPWDAVEGEPTDVFGASSPRLAAG